MCALISSILYALFWCLILSDISPQGCRHPLLNQQVYLVSHLYLHSYHSLGSKCTRDEIFRGFVSLAPDCLLTKLSMVSLTSCCYHVDMTTCPSSSCVDASEAYSMWDLVRGVPTLPAPAPDDVSTSCALSTCEHV